MPAARPEGSIQDGTSLEVRWIFPGQLSTAVAAGSSASRLRRTHEMTPYLPAPHLRWLSVKLRWGRNI